MYFKGDIMKNTRGPYNIKRKVDNSIFKEKINPYSSYLLGFLWADGYLRKDGFVIQTEIIKKDADNIFNIFLKTGGWNNDTRNRKNKQIQSRIWTSNSILHKDMLNFYEFKNKNNNFNLINKIPKNLQCYCLRGYFDGDGNIYQNKKQYLNQLSFTAPCDFDWSALTKILDSISVEKYATMNIKRDKNSSSKLRITNKKDISKLGKYMYKGEFFGLTRKFNVIQNIISSIN